ncbi:MAG: acyl-ACP desaturase, partial [Ignavibacterium sp.]
MEIIVNNQPTEEREIKSKTEVLNELESKVKEWMEQHIAKRRLWFSSDFLPVDEKNTDDKNKIVDGLRHRAKGIKDPARVAVALNLLTEEGLPHFHRLIAQHLGSESFWSKWNNMWTGEEDRHGNILRDYARD